MFSMCRCDWNTKTLLENNHPLAGSNYLKFAKRLKQIGPDNGIVCNQSHAPFSSRFPDVRSYFRRALECTAEAGALLLKALMLIWMQSESFVACLDIGHAEMRGSGTSAIEMIHALGNRFQALHIHDNDLKHDSHQIPFSMRIDFNAVVSALKEIDYSGYFTLEASDYLKAYTAENIFNGIQKLANSARRLADMYDMHTI